MLNYKGLVLVLVALTGCGGGSGSAKTSNNSVSSVVGLASSSSSLSSPTGSSNSSISSSGPSSAYSSMLSSSSAPVFIEVSGVVVDESALPIEDAIVEVIGSNQQVATLADGSFSLDLSTTTPAVLRVEKTGYSGTFRAAESPDRNAAIAARIVMPKVVATLTFKSSDDAVLRVPGSLARVELPKSSLIDAEGLTATGDITVQLTPIDPSKNVALMPGVMVDSDTSDAIESLGAMGVEFTDANGKSLNLGAGKTASIRIPATPSPGSTPPATMPLYHLNETTGKWDQDGTASLHTDAQTGAQYYEGTVSHFSWWNADQIMNRVDVSVERDVNGNICSIPSGFELISVGVSYNGTTATDPSQRKFFAKPESQIRVLLLDSAGNYADEIPLTTGSVGTVSQLPRCLSPQPKVTVSGKVNVISGDPSFYRVQLSGTNLVAKTLGINSDGTYSVDVYRNIGDVNARLIGSKNNRSLVTSAKVTVGATNIAFADLNLEGETVVLSGCVDGWETYRHASATLSVFEGASSVPVFSKPLTSELVSGRRFSTDVLVNTPYSLRITTPDASLVEKVTSVDVGGTSVSLEPCLKLPVPPTASLQSTGSGFSRNFDASASTAGDAAIASYQWDFGDGTSASTPITSHSYNATGSYTVTLRLTDALGQISLAKTTVVITNSQEFSVLTPATGLNASVSGSGVCSVVSGSPWCWGSNRSFELGRAQVSTVHCESCEPIKTTTSGLQSSGVPLQISSQLTGVTSIAVGENHSCALVATGAVFCWGDGQYGQLGQKVESSANIRFAEGEDFSCSLANLTLDCFGGQLASFMQRSAAPVQVVGIGNAVAISVGSFMSCALLADGTVWCWGSSYGLAINPEAPVQIAGLSEVSSISVGRAHACAVLKTGGIRCWGSGRNGELGNGTTSDSATPVAVSGITNALSVSAGRESNCAVLADGQVRCWGYRGISGFGGTLLSGLIGDGEVSTAPATVPVEVAGLTSAIAVDVSSTHVCAIKDDNSLWCWGRAAKAMGTTQGPVLSPLQITALPAVSAVAVGRDVTCATLTTGKVQCLGENSSGQLGSGGEELLVDNVVQTSPTYPSSITPVNVIGLP